MTMFLVVRRQSGPLWDRAKPLEEQSSWAEHAAFMDALVDAGFIVLGGPLDGELKVAFAIEADSPDAVRARLAGDPWHETHLQEDSVERWTIRLDGRQAT